MYTTDYCRVGDDICYLIFDIYLILDEIYFWLDVYSELLLDRLDNFVAEVDDFLRRCSASVDEDKALLLIDACTSEGLALPSALLDEPAGRNLDELIAHIVVREMSVGRSGNNGILEEGTSIAKDLRVGQLALTDGNDGIADILQGRSRNIGKGLFQSCIFEMEDRRGVQLQDDARDDVAALSLRLLEQGSTVAVLHVLA